jgi:hypothetical protein
MLDTIEEHRRIPSRSRLGRTLLAKGGRAQGETEVGRTYTRR